MHFYFFASCKIAFGIQRKSVIFLTSLCTRR